MSFKNRINSEVKTQPASQFLAHPDNPKIHPQSQRDALNIALNELGFVAPAIVNVRTGYLVDGHERVWQALQDDSDVPYIEIDVDEAEERAILATLDPIGMMAMHDGEKLADLLNTSDLSDLLTDSIADFAGVQLSLDEPQEAPEPQIDRAEELRVKWGTERGQLWVIPSAHGGEHRLLCGDSTNADDVARLMGSVRVDMVFTDPPYNLASHADLFAQSAVRDSYKTLSESDWDKDFNILDALDLFLDILADDVTVYICTSQFLAPEIFVWMSKHFDFYYYCVWCKPNPMPSLSKRHWTWGTELIPYATRGKHAFNFPNQGHALNWWDMSSLQHNRKHPTQKPVGLPSHALLHSSNEGDNIYDPFLGSGTTMIACEQLQRVCYGTEIDPKFCAVILERMSDMGLEPRLSND